MSAVWEKLVSGLLLVTTMESEFRSPTLIVHQGGCVLANQGVIGEIVHHGDVDPDPHLGQLGLDVLE